MFPSAVTLSPDGLVALAMERNLVVGVRLATGCGVQIAGTDGASGFADGLATSAFFSRPQGTLLCGLFLWCAVRMHSWKVCFQLTFILLCGAVGFMGGVEKFVGLEIDFEIEKTRVLADPFFCLMCECML